MSAASALEAPQTRRWSAWLGGWGRFAIGAAACMTPLTAMIALGWLTRLTERESAVERLRRDGAAVDRPALPNWFVSETAPGRRGVLGALWANASQGVGALAMFLVSTLPFTALLMFAWWAGWENSFHKGYEHYAVGPSVSIGAIILGLVLLARLPMAMAVYAATGRIGAAWSAEVTRLINAAGWRYLVLTAAFFLAALPIFALRGLPTFVEGWRDGFADMTPRELARFALFYRLAAAIYLIGSAIILRRWLGRTHGVASRRLAHEARGSGAASWFGWIVRGALVGILWFGVIAQIYVAQFLNHSWLAWLNHPLIGLPWAASAGAGRLPL